MTRYVWRDGDFVSRETGEPMHVTFSGVCKPYILSDTPAYVSPVTGKTIDGRAARREEMKRENLVELPPLTKKRGVYSEKIANKFNLPLIGRDCGPEDA